METVRVVVIGFGGMGSKYAEILGSGRMEGMTLQGICCRNEKGQKQIREMYPQAAIYRNVEDTFAHGADFDAVIIVTPHETHAEIGRMAFACGKHVLCDKPIGISTRQARQFLAEKREDTAFAMMFNQRTRPAFIKAKELLEKGELGSVSRVVWVCNDWFRTPAYHHSAPWRSSWSREYGGLLINQCQHYLDMWRWLFGTPDSVDADLDFGKYNDFLVDDGVDIRFLYNREEGKNGLGEERRYPGLRGNLISSTGEHPGVNRMEIWGSRGRVTITNGKVLAFDKNSTDLEDFKRENKGIYAMPAHEESILMTGEERDAYGKVIQNFGRHILTGEPLIAAGEDGLYGLMLANAAYLSAWTGKRTELPVDDIFYEQMLQKMIEKEQARK